jgi:hypothetical protein
MAPGDRIVERGSERLHGLAQKAARRGGLAAKLAPPLEEDAEFLRRLKPSLIKARATGDAPTDAPPAEPGMLPPPAPKPRRDARGGPSPLVLIGAAAAAGFVLAKLIDWRSHAHPRV